MLIFWGFTEKSDFQGGGSRKTSIEGGDCPKRGGLGLFLDLRGLDRKEGDAVFERGIETPMHTMYTLRIGETFRILILNFSLKVWYVFYVPGFLNPIQDKGQKGPSAPLPVFLPFPPVEISPQNFTTS